MPPQNPSEQPPLSAPLNEVVPETSARTLPLIVAGIAVVAVITGIVWWFAPRAQEVVSPALPKKIGIAYFRQGLSAVEGLKTGMAKLGYTDKDIIYIEEEIQLGPNLAQDLDTAMRKFILEDKVDLIWEDHEQQTKIAVDVTKELGDTTPIVFLSRFHDPVEYGLVAAYQSSGNNATGVVQNLVDVASRNLSFFREIYPKIEKVGVFSTGFLIPGVGEAYLEELKRQADKLGMEIVEYKTDVPPPQAETAWNAIADTLEKGDIDALIHIPGHFYPTQESAEYELAKRLKIPHYAPKEDIPGGGHFSYSSDFKFAGEQSASIVDRILKGTKPSDIPVEYGKNVDLTLHMGRARETGITFSESMIYIAKTKIDETTSTP